MTSRHILLLSCHVHCSSFYVARLICKYAIKNLLSQRGDHVSPLKYTHLLLKVQCVKYHDYMSVDCRLQSPESFQFKSIILAMVATLVVIHL